MRHALFPAMPVVAALLLGTLAAGCGTARRPALAAGDVVTPQLLPDEAWVAGQPSFFTIRLDHRPGGGPSAGPLAPEQVPEGVRLWAEVTFLDGEREVETRRGLAVVPPPC